MNEDTSMPPDLERLLRQQPLPEPHAGFAKGVMARLDAVPPPRSLWQQPWLQWLAVGLGFGFGLVRLISYVLGAWLALEAAL